jgi:site-specific recombinase XerD
VEIVDHLLRARVGQHALGLVAQRFGRAQTAETAIQVRVLLAALKRLYEALSAAGLYAHANPLAHEDAAQIASKLYELRYQAMLAAEGRGPMPVSSGVDSPTEIRCPENYFRFVDQQWVPKSIDDPAFPNVVYAAGKEHGWSLRELCIVRTLFEAGPRISEVLSLTALDWMPSHFTNAFRCPNKGSHGQRTKTLMVSQATAKLFRKYFDDDVGGRRAWDPQRRTVATLTNLSTHSPDELSRIPLFLTARSSVMTAKLFRDEHWRPALRAAGLDAHPHLARHWFVTNALRNIEAFSQDRGEMCRRRQELIQYMGWRSGEQTLKAYEHVRRERSFLKQLSSIHKAMHRSEKNYAKRGSGSMACDPEPGRRSTDLAFLLGEDDEC